MFVHCVSRILWRSLVRACMDETSLYYYYVTNRKVNRIQKLKIILTKAPGYLVPEIRALAFPRYPHRKSVIRGQQGRNKRQDIPNKQVPMNKNKRNSRPVQFRNLGAEVPANVHNNIIRKRCVQRCTVYNILHAPGRDLRMGGGGGV